MKPALIALTATAALLAAAAHAETANTCFRTNDIRNHTVADDHTLYIAVGNHDVYRLGTKGSCAEPSDSHHPLIIKTPGSSGMVCRPLDLDLSIGRSGFVTPCIVDSITKLSKANVAALPKKLRP